MDNYNLAIGINFDGKLVNTLIFQDSENYSDDDILSRLKDSDIKEIIVVNVELPEDNSNNFITTLNKLLTLIDTNPKYLYTLKHRVIHE